MAINSRNKGNALELQVAKLFAAASGLKIRRTPLSGGWSHENPDVRGDLVCTTPNAKFGYCIECKNAEGWRLESLWTANHKWFNDWWRQARDEAKTGDKVPILIFSKRYTPLYAAVESTGELLLEMPQVPYMLYHHPDGQEIIIMLLTDLLTFLAF